MSAQLPGSALAPGGDAATQSPSDVHAVLSEESSKDEGAWTGLLCFLNDPKCYCKDPDMKLKRSASLLSHDWAHQSPHRKGLEYFKRCRAGFGNKSSPVKPVDASEPCSRCRTAVGRVVMSPFCETLVMFVILVDVGIIIYKLCKHPDDTIGFGDTLEDHQLYSDDLVTMFSAIDWFVFSVLCVDICGRVVYLGADFTHSILNLVEFCLVPLMLFELVTRREGAVAGLPLPVVRACRPIIRSVNIIAKAMRGVRHALKLRHSLQETVAGVHKRFVSDGFNLDLCYITSQLIAMGRPAVGKDALFNNPLSELARFFDTRHENKYLVINASEGYDYPRWPLQYRVINFPIGTHSIPKLLDLWQLCEAIKTFLDQDERHVVAVHGYFNGGQVGMVIAAYMLFCGSFRQAAAAMNNYERARTAAGAGESVQGFDNASQRRFIEYFSSCVHEVHAVPDPPPWASLKSIRLIGLDSEKVADGLSVKLFVRHGLGAYKGKSLAGDEVFEEQNNELKDDEYSSAVFALQDEESVVKLAAEEKDKMQFDSLNAGCHALPGRPFLDTGLNTDFTCKGQAVLQQGDDQSGNVLTWRCEGVEFSGELRAEIHLHGSRHSGRLSRLITQPVKTGGILNRWKSKKSGSDIEEANLVTSTEKAPTILLFASWFHTAFLKHSQSMSMRRELGDNTIGIALGRFGVDKGTDAPGLKTYGASFQLQLVFEVDEQASIQQGRVTRHVKNDDDEEDGKRVLRKLHPPDENSDVTDFYSIGWLSWMLEKLWPFTEVALVKLIRETVEPTLQESVPGPLRSIHFSTFNLGTNAPELGPMVASQREGDGVQLDLIVKYTGNANILMDAGIASFGVNHIELVGTLSILLDPIVDHMPIVGGMKLFFLNPPEVHLKFVGLAEIANMPSIQGVLEGTIQDVFADVLVLPNVLCINWMDDPAQFGDPPAYLSNRLPNGVLRVIVIEAEGVSQEQKFYIKVKFGSLSRKTSTCRKSLQPRWNEICDLLLFDLKQTLCIEMYSSSLTGDKLVAKSSQLEAGQLVRGDNPTSWIVLDPPTSKKMRKGKRKSSISSFRNLPSFSASQDTNFVRVHLDFQLFTLVADAGHLPTKVDDGAAAATAKASASESNNVGLLICKCHKGRLPSGSIVGAKLCVRVGSNEASEKVIQSDFSWHNFAELTESTVNTIGVLVREGYAVVKIAEILKLPEALVNKVMAHCLEFNIDVPQHLCVFVTESCLENGNIALEIRRKGRVEAQGRIALKDVIEGGKKSDAGVMKIRRLVHMRGDPRARSRASSNRNDLDVELHFFAFSASRATEERRRRPSSVSPAKDMQSTEEKSEALDPKPIRCQDTTTDI